jgi:hypothetical protein
LYGSTSGDHQTNGTANFMSKLRQSFCRFRRQDLVHGHTPAIQPLKHGQLAGTETKNLSVNIWNGRRSLIVFG